MSEEHEDEDPDHGWTAGTDILTRFSHAELAVSLAGRVKDELVAPGSIFAAYVKDAQDRATGSLVALCTVDPRDSYEILRLQKEIAGYADVTDWISKTMARGEEARDEYEEIVSSAQQIPEEE